MFVFLRIYRSFASLYSSTPIVVPSNVIWNALPGACNCLFTCCITHTQCMPRVWLLSKSFVLSCMHKQCTLVSGTLLLISATPTLHLPSLLLPPWQSIPLSCCSSLIRLQNRTICSNSNSNRSVLAGHGQRLWGLAFGYPTHTHTPQTHTYIQRRTHNHVH